MKRESLRPVTLALALALALAQLAGCLGESPTAPSAPSGEEAPVLPAPEKLTFDFDFFREPALREQASKRNFLNAYLRVVIVSAVVHVGLTPPVAAFSLALHTPPSPQPDGSWIWVYTYVNGEEEAQIRLRGKAVAGDGVQWELRVTNLGEVPPVDNAVWFEGETRHDGDSGFFRFHDVHDEAGPVDARLDWGADPDGDFLRFTDLRENPDDTLEFREAGSRKSLTFTDASDPDLGWYVRWDESDGTGSLRAPDYNGGEPACWDEHQSDTECGPAL